MNVNLKKTAPPEEKKAPGILTHSSVSAFILSVTAGEDPMAEMLARIKSGNVHLKKIEGITSVINIKSSYITYCPYACYLLIFTGEEETRK